MTDYMKIIPIEGQLGFTDTYIPDASLCIPAAYTGFQQHVLVKDGKMGIRMDR